MSLSNGYTDIPAGKLAMTVTDLEMRERVVDRREPFAEGWTFGRQERPSTDWYRALYLHIGRDWLWFSRLKLTDAALTELIQDDRVEVWTLQVEGRNEGIAELDFRQVGECEITYFGVHSSLVGSGAGRFMMNRVIAHAWSHPIRRLWLHTCTNDHPSALRFYQRSGFVPCRRRVEIEDDPRLNGILPSNSAPQVPIL